MLKDHLVSRIHASGAHFSAFRPLSTITKMVSDFARTKTLFRRDFLFSHIPYLTSFSFFLFAHSEYLEYFESFFFLRGPSFWRGKFWPIFIDLHLASLLINYNALVEPVHRVILDKLRTRDSISRRLWRIKRPQKGLLLSIERSEPRNWKQNEKLRDSRNRYHRRYFKFWRRQSYCCCWRDFSIHFEYGFPVTWRLICSRERQFSFYAKSEPVRLVENLNSSITFH